MQQSANLDLPYLMPSQAQKHITHNEALARLDALVQLSVLDRDLAAPPVSPASGERYIVAAGATGAWAGWDLSVAVFSEGAWMRLMPRDGWTAWIADEAALVVWDGSAWQRIAGPVLSSHTVATLPSPSPAGQLVYVADGAGNRRLAVADGTGWRWPDGAVVS